MCSPGNLGHSLDDSLVDWLYHNEIVAMTASGGCSLVGAYGKPHKVDITMRNHRMCGTANARYVRDLRQIWRFEVELTRIDWPM